jgi:hypothetical protein
LYKKITNKIRPTLFYICVVLLGLAIEKPNNSLAHIAIEKPNNSLNNSLAHSLMKAIKQFVD